VKVFLVSFNIGG